MIDTPATLEGVPLQVVRSTPQVARGGGVGCVPCHNNQLSLPVQMGNSGGSNAAGQVCVSCTMGFKACELATGDGVWVSAAHCAFDATTCPGTAPIGSAGFHVSPADAPVACSASPNVGNISQQAPPVANGNVDAVSFDSNNALTLTTVRDIAGGIDDVAGTVIVGDEVRKSGRTTGLTNGTVSAVNVAVSVNYAPCGTISLQDQFQVTGLGGNVFCQGGDSGAGVFNFSDPAQVVGLVMSSNTAGTTCTANEAGNVLAALGLSMNHTACVEDLCPAIDITRQTSDPASTLDLVYRLRDEVLGATEAGKLWIRTFYDVAPAWVALYRQRPQLFNATRASLEDNLFVLKAIVNNQPVTIPQARLNAVRQLLSQHIQGSNDRALDAAFAMWRAALGDPATQQAFGVTVN